MAKEPELKPCPWCGRKPKLREWTCGCDVICDNPKCAVLPHIMGTLKTKRGAINAWNRRKEEKNV